MSLLKKAAIALAIIVIGAQFIRPSRANLPVDAARTIQANMEVPPEVTAILARSCDDCHSSTTQWPWYSNVAPVSWLLAHHVNDGREELSFSDWSSYTPKRAAHKLKEICEQLEKGEMPLQSYVLLHRSAALSDADKEVLCDWARKEHARLVATLPASEQ
jgi:hypothetical protein